MKTKRHGLTTTSPPPPPPQTPIASLPDDVVADILLCLPSPAAILRAALASWHWCRVVFSPAFLRRIRALHPFPPLHSHFVSHGSSTLPLFEPAPLHSDPVLSAVVRRGDFFFTRLQDSGQCALEDCRDGLLLFSNKRRLTVFDPIAHRAVSVRRPSRLRDPDHGYVAHTFCLLRDSGGADDREFFFRVISLQHRKRSARADVYDSRTGDWRVHPGTAAKPARSHRNRYFPAMHAAGRIYWKYSSRSLLLSLDTRTMHFSYERLPPGVSYWSPYAVGETEDGACCLVHVSYGSNGCPRLRVCLCKEEGNGTQIPWELEREVPLILRSAAPAHGKVRQVRAIVAGLVLVCLSSRSPYLPHVAFRLKSLKVEAEFTCRGPGDQHARISSSDGIALCCIYCPHVQNVALDTVHAISSLK